jgi:hypothetical protein
MDIMYKKKDIKILITGCPHSATGYMYKLFESAGMVSGHESIYGNSIKPKFTRKEYIKGFIKKPEFKKGMKELNKIYLKKLEVESSWFAAPFLNDFLDDTKIIHLTRNPLKVIRSISRSHYFENEESNKLSTKFIMNYIPDIFSYENEIDRSTFFWIKWNELIEERLKNHKNNIRVKIEDINQDPEGFLRSIGVSSTKKLYLDINYNQHFKGDEELAIISSKINIELINDLEEKAKKYGYII